MTATALVRAPTVERFEPARRSWVELMAPAVELAKAIASTDFVPRGLRNNPPAIAAAILYGDEIGVGPMQSLATIAVIDGRPFVAAQTQRALVLATGHDLWLDESTTTRATWAGRRAGSDQVTRITWTMDDARRARLDGKPNWRAYPRPMLSARASAELVRAAFADVVAGLGAIEELDEFDPGLVGLGAQPTIGPASPTAAPDGTRRRRRPSTRVASAPVAAASAPPAPAVESARPPISTPDDWRASGRPPLPHEVADDEPGPMMTAAQRRRMHALFRSRGISERAERLRLSSEWIGRKVASATELSSREADRVLDVLESMGEPVPDEPAPVDEPQAPDEPVQEGLDV